jgi:hypothetical protein
MDTLAWWSEHIFLVAIPYFLLGTVDRTAQSS